MSRELHVLCAGAVQGFVEAVQDRFASETGALLHARFGAVGAMKDALAAGSPCDVLIVTDAMLHDLQTEDAFVGAGRTAIGGVLTGVAARTGEPLPRVDSADSLKSTLLAASAVYIPDVERSTAGKHVLSVLGALGLLEALLPKLAIHANGATAMHELAQRGPPGAIGCTQITEIRRTPGLALAGALPDPFGLATVYSAAVTKKAADPALAARFIALLGSRENDALRRACGFDPPG